MRNAITQAFLYEDKKHFKIAGDLELEMNIKENRLRVPINSILEMAARKNKKRSFLFVSKLLGKHIPVHPEIVSLGGHLLAHLFFKKLEKNIPVKTNLIVKALSDKNYLPIAMSHVESIKLKIEEPTLFIGFAETATGLGHAMYSAFTGNTGFIHTTRDNIKELKSVFSFDEEHSHATLHMCYAIEKNFIENFSRIVLVDDEITTGKTALNLIRAFNKKFSGKKYAVASLLDWRSDEEISNYRNLEEELNITIDNISLIKGNIRTDGNTIELRDYNTSKIGKIKIKIDTIKIPLEDKYKFTFIDSFGNEKNAVYSRINGRFGIYEKDNEYIEKEINRIGNILKNMREKEKCLCLGCNEFIYIPAMIARKMGKNIYFQSTTRSPIYPINKSDYAIKSSMTFSNPHDSGIVNFVYNVLPGSYEEVFYFLERDVDEEKKKEIAEKFARCGVKIFKFVVFS